jgi:2-keto-4-pentenoate hydratase/2-oxohepta-3-ene-1,7-dioic acid hydratase in catechol pathway
MKFVSFSEGEREGWGAVKDGGIVDLGQRLKNCKRLIDMLRHDRMAEAVAEAEHADLDLSLADIRYRRPVPFPEKIVCIGVNYANRNAEYKDGSAEAQYPSLFMRAPDSLVGHLEPIVRPPESDQLDYEGEIALIIGKGGRRIDPKNVREHIAGLSCLNEGTLRDWLRHSKFNVTQGKNFVASGSVGPWMVSTDEFKSFDNLSVKTRVNAEVRQDDTTANIIFDFAYIVSYLSKFMELKPGDIIATGTPVGAGARFDPPKWLKPGDTVEVEVGGIGVLSNTVVDEKL